MWHQIRGYFPKFFTLVTLYRFYLKSNKKGDVGKANFCCDEAANPDDDLRGGHLGRLLPRREERILKFGFYFLQLSPLHSSCFGRFNHLQTFLWN